MATRWRVGRQIVVGCDVSDGVVWMVGTISVGSLFFAVDNVIRLCDTVSQTMQVTVQQIAERAGVSKMTVSRALRGVGRVSAETRARIRRIARELGHHQMGRVVISSPLHRGRTEHQLAVFVPVLHPDDIHIEFSQELLRGLRDALARQGGRLEFRPCGSLDEILSAWEESGAQGVLLQRQVPSAWVERLRRVGAVVYAGGYDHQPGVDSVYTNEHRAAAMIMDLLTGLGHRDIVWFSLVDLHAEGMLPRSLFDESTAVDRMTSSVHGVRHAAWANLTYSPEKETHRSLLILERDWDRESLDEVISRGLNQILVRRPMPTAIVVSTDDMGIALLRALQRRGWHVPQDLSVVSYGGTKAGQAISPPLTSVKLPMYAMGKVIPELIERRLAEPDALPISVQFEAKLLSGKTVGPAHRTN